jgi:DNA-binding MarR family transcriptional regulator
MAESRPQENEFLEPEEWQSMNALLLLHRRVLSDLDAALRREHGLTVTEFDVLITLFNAEDERIGMSALADRVLLSPAGMTHLITRLERDGLVRREPGRGDRRKFHAVLTNAGQGALREARQTHNQVLRRGLLAATTAADRRTLQRIWRRLSESD